MFIAIDKRIKDTRHFVRKLAEATEKKMHIRGQDLVVEEFVNPYVLIEAYDKYVQDLLKVEKVECEFVPFNNILT